MKHALAIIHLILIVLAAVLLSAGILPKPYDVILSAVVLLISATSVILSSRGREKRYLDRITGLSRELDVASSRISSVSQEIGITIAENNDSSQDLFEQVRQMKNLTAGVSACLEDMIVSIKSMISNGEETRKTARAMEDTGKASFETIQSSISEIMGIVAAMSDIKATSGKASASMERLSAASSGVLTIVDKISDISKQMHIIAVNASVEAVRAGSSGSSFTVVARQFQNLSSMTDNAVSSIGDLIDSIQAGIREVYSAVNENNARVDTGVRNSMAVEQNLNMIHQSFSNVIAMVENINSISDSEARLAEEVGSGLEQIETLIADTGENVARVYQSTLSQRKGNENVSQMGIRLRSASSELLAITGSEGPDQKEGIDNKTKEECAAYFEIIRDALCRHPDIAGKDPERHYALLSRFKAQYPIVEAVWTNDKNGRFICSIPKAGIANAAMREWFIAAIKGESFISSIYISGITKNRCITLSMPCPGIGNEIGGVVGVDLNLGMLKSRTRRHRA